MKTSITLAGYILVIALLSTACTDNINIEQEITYNLRGKVEKGPFVQGSRVTVFELNASLVPTGRSFIAETGNDDGSFSLNSVELVSPFVLLDANGFYFNEVSGKLSDAPINLNALVDLRQNVTANVNPLTHLERRRVEHLLANGKSFPQAKVQAQQEILAVFGLSAKWQAEQAELSDNDAILLTVSSILQGFRTEAELTRLMNTFAQDIAQNGEITNKNILASMSNDASRLSTDEISNNLTAYYQSIGVQINVPDVAQTFAGFLEQNPPVSSGITYPETGKYGVNLLAEGDEIRFGGGKYSTYNCSFATELEAGTRLSVRLFGQCFTEEISNDSTTYTYVIERCNEWGYIDSSVSSWTFAKYNATDRTQDVTIAGKASGDAHIQLSGTGEILLEIYENVAIVPTRRKTIIIENK